MRQLFSGAILIMAVLSAGCVSTEFYAVSDTSGETGGITLVKSRTDTARNLFTHLKTVNYLIRDRPPGFFTGLFREFPEQNREESRPSGWIKAAGWKRLPLVQGQRRGSVSSGAVAGRLFSLYGELQFRLPHGTAVEKRDSAGGKSHSRTGGGAPENVRKKRIRISSASTRRGKNLHAVDLGLDQVKIYPWHAGRGIDTKAVEIIRLHAGAGRAILSFLRTEARSMLQMNLTAPCLRLSAAEGNGRRRRRSAL